MSNFRDRIAKLTTPDHYTHNFKMRAYEWLRQQGLDGTSEESNYADCLMRELTNYREIITAAQLNHKR